MCYIFVLRETQLADRQTHFSWFVSNEPPRVIDIGGGRWIAERVSAPRRPYLPLVEKTGLYREFVDTKPTDDGVLTFAGRYGLLGSAQPNTVRGEPEFWIERLDFWQRAIRLMRLAERLRGSLAARDFGGIKGLFADQDGKIVLSLPARNSPFQPLGDLSIPLSIPAFQLPRDTYQIAASALQQITNDQLEGNVSSRLYWNSAFTKASLHRVPSNLLAAMWLQFARTIEGNKEHAQCEECRTWFEIGAGEGSRRDARFCGSACRARAWRKNRGNK